MASNHNIVGKVRIHKIEGRIFLNDIYEGNYAENFKFRLSYPINDEDQEYLELLIESAINQNKLRFKGTKRSGNESNPIVINDIRKVRI
jgi:uncharacterized protein YggL (DUF469 family)